MFSLRLCVCVCVSVCLCLSQNILHRILSFLIGYHLPGSKHWTSFYGIRLCITHFNMGLWLKTHNAHTDSHRPVEKKILRLLWWSRTNCKKGVQRRWSRTKCKKRGYKALQLLSEDVPHNLQEILMWLYLLNVVQYSTLSGNIFALIMKNGNFCHQTSNFYPNKMPWCLSFNDHPKCSSSICLCTFKIDSSYEYMIKLWEIEICGDGRRAFLD